MKPRDGKAPYDKSLRPVRQPGQMGDWAAILAVALFVGLWLLWPNVPDRPQRPRGMPDPSCAYGVLSPSSSAGDVLARFNGGPAGEDPDKAFARLPAIAVPEIPAPSPALAPGLPPPAYAAAGRDFPSPPILPEPPAFPFRRDAHTGTAVVVKAADSLRDANFSFDASAISNGAPFSLAASLAFDGNGDVDFLVIDDFAGPPGLLPAWWATLQLSHAAPGASGTVDISRR